jgi:hypothetical protein
MNELSEMMDQRRNGIPYDDLAREIGMKTPTLFRYIAGQRNMSVLNIRKIATWAREKDDKELINALVSYAIGFEI